MDFQEFLEEFIPKIRQKSKQVNQISWILETTGSQDAADLKAELETELRLLFHDKSVYEKLKYWEKNGSIEDPLLKRQLNVLIRMFKPNLIQKELLEKITQEEAHLAFLYSNFRPQMKDRSLSENAILEILKSENDVASRKEAYEASKQIGKVLAPHILQLVHLRNKAASALGYANYFSMQLDLQEVDEEWLFSTLDQLAEKSDAAYLQLIDEIRTKSSKRFAVKKEEIGPWAWSDPFSQENPLDVKELDALAADVDLIKVSKEFYQAMDLDVEEILKRSDNFEREGKNQHAFCTHIDREGDIRTLNNVQQSLRWMETLLHELGHAVYELGYDPKLPYLLKEPPHMITTEAMALLAGRQAYRPSSLEQLAPQSSSSLRGKAEEALKRRQLIFSRWVLVMTYFERELYRHPEQDLNKLWWHLVEKYQKISFSGSSSGCDWAAKYHIGLAPVYYFSYLLGELFASSLEKRFPRFANKETGKFLCEKLFAPGDSLKWSELIKQVLGEELNAKDWLRQFA